jgi:hypothetical protein
MTNYYNHPRWPSPCARLVAIKLDLDVVSRYPFTRMKRLTHAQALELLRKRTRKATIEEFLAMPEQEAWIALGCTHQSPWSREPIAYNPLYGPRRYY